MTRRKKINVLSIKEIDVKGKRVFARFDFNVPLNGRREIIDDTRIKAALPTLKYLLDNGARVICASHLGQPNGRKKSGYTLAPVAERLSQLLDQEVTFHENTTGRAVESLKAKLHDGEILLLQNLRYNTGETRNDPRFANELAQNIDIYVNDAFGVSHRNHASIDQITKFVPIKAAGLLLKNEMDFLTKLSRLSNNCTVILGGSKGEDKIPHLSLLLDKVSKILIGGAIAYTFLKAKGFAVGSSEVQEDCIPICREILQKAEKKGVKIILPVDHIAALTIEPEVTIRMIKKGEEIPDGMMGLDIGFETIQLFSKELKGAELIVWNGPLGVFEIDTFGAGTIEIAREVTAGTATTVVGGGDSIAAINKADVANKISHISTGGIAALMFFAGQQLPGIQALMEEK